MNHTLKALILDLNKVMDKQEDTIAVVKTIVASVMRCTTKAFQNREESAHALMLTSEAIAVLGSPKMIALGGEVTLAVNDLMEEGCPKGQALDVLLRRIMEVLEEEERKTRLNPNACSCNDGYQLVAHSIKCLANQDTAKAETLVNFLNAMYRAEHFNERKPRLSQWVAHLPTNVVLSLYQAFVELVGPDAHLNPSMHLARVVETSSRLLAEVRPSGPKNIDEGDYPARRKMPLRQLRGRMQSLPEGESISQPTEHAQGAAKIAAEHNLLEELGKFLQMAECSLGAGVKVMTFEDGELKEVDVEDTFLSKFIDENLPKRKVKEDAPVEKPLVKYTIHPSWVAKALELNYNEFILHFGEDGTVIELMHPRTHREKPDSVAVARCTFNADYGIEIEWLYSANHVFEGDRPIYHVVKIENLQNYELPEGWFWNDNSVIDGTYLMAYQGK